MHLVTLTRPISDLRWNLAVGTYLAEDLSAFEIAMAADRGTAFVQLFERPQGWTINLSGAPSRLLWIHNGGFGDLMMAVPAIREFARSEPAIELTISCRERVHCVFDHLPFAPKLIPYPVPIGVADTFNKIVCSEHIQEASDEGKTTPAVDLKAKLLGVGPLVVDQRKTEYVVTETERNYAAALVPRNHRKRIGIQLVASSPTRTWHKTRMTELLTFLYDKGYECLLFGAPGSLPEDAIPASKRDLIRNMIPHGLTFRQSAAVAQTCDCLFTPDSAFVHLAGALNIPCVAIFGSTHWKLRTADYPTVLAVQGNGGCPIQPCWFHPKGHQIFPADQTCAKAGYCSPLNNIDAATVVAKIEKQLAAYSK